MHIKLIVVGIIAIAAVIFGVLFWQQLSQNQQELAGRSSDLSNVNPSPRNEVSKENTVDSIEADIAGTDLNFDSNSNQLQSEASGL